MRLYVLVGELLAVDRLSAGTVAAGEVACGRSGKTRQLRTALRWRFRGLLTALEHELGDDTVEGRSGVTCAKGRERAGGRGSARRLADGSCQEE